MNCANFESSVRRVCLGLTLTLLLFSGAGCSSVLPPASPQPATYTLDGVSAAAGAEQRPARPWRAAAPVLVVSPPRAAAGFDSRHIVYVREAHRLEYFAHNEWAEPPARMLAPLIVTSLEHSDNWRAVSTTPSAAASDLRLDTEILRLQHEFGAAPSRVRFTLRAYLVDNATRQLIGSREFDATIAAVADDPVGGVAAANLAVQGVLSQLARFVSEAARSWQPATDCSIARCPRDSPSPKEPLHEPPRK